MANKEQFYFPVIWERISPGGDEMKVRELMTGNVIPIHPEETVQVAARTLKQHNIGFLPVCGSDGKLCGLVTDRDLVTRCIAANRSPAKTTVREVMTGQVMIMTSEFYGIEDPTPEQMAALLLLLAASRLACWLSI